MKAVRINASSPYNVIIGRDLLSDAGKYIKDAVGACRICIVTDDNVDRLYAKTLENALNKG